VPTLGAGKSPSISWAAGCHPALSPASARRCSHLYHTTGTKHPTHSVMGTFSFRISIGYIRCEGKRGNVEGNVGNRVREWCFESCRASDEMFFLLPSPSHASLLRMATWTDMCVPSFHLGGPGERLSQSRQLPIDLSLSATGACYGPRPHTDRTCRALLLYLPRSARCMPFLEPRALWQCGSCA
jgi:hypothetical protein